jgi:hypothetical protein
MSKRRWQRAVVAVACLAAGCVAEEAGPAGATFRFEWWVWAPWLAAAAVLAAVPPLAFLLRPAWRGRLPAAGVAALAVGLGAVPACMGAALMVDRVVVGPDHFEVGDGLLPYPRASFRYADVTALGLTQEAATDEKGRTTRTTHLMVESAAGRRLVRAGSLVRSSGVAKRLGDAARERGVKVTGL